MDAEPIAGLVVLGLVLRELRGFRVEMRGFRSELHRLVAVVAGLRGVEPPAPPAELPPVELPPSEPPDPEDRRLSLVGRPMGSHGTVHP